MMVSLRNPVGMCGILGLMLALAVLVPQAYGASVKAFGAEGDGVADDTEAIRRAVRETPNGIVEFPRGEYRTTETIRIDLEQTGRVSLQGGGVGRVIMEGPGPAFHFAGTHRRTAGPSSFEPGVFEQQRMPQVDGLEITGTHPEADGLEFSFVMQPTVRGVLIHRVRHGVRFTPGDAGRERIVTSNRNVIIADSHIYDCRGAGVFFDMVDLHQANITGSHISFCKRGGIRMERTSIRNLQIVGNDIEYNYDADVEESADILVDIREGGSVREGTIVGNTIQAVRTPGGANIRLLGAPDSPDKIGLFAVTGNHISSQEVNLHLQNVRGVTISGNSFIRGGTHTMLIEQCRNIVVGTNSLDNNTDYISARQTWQNGLSVHRSEGVVLSGVQVDGSLLGSPEGGGAVEIVESRNVTMTGCQVLAPRFRGVYIRDSANVQVANCLVTAEEDPAPLVAGIEIAGKSKAVMVRDNLVASGRNGTVVGTSEGGVIGENHLPD